MKRSILTLTVGLVIFGEAFCSGSAARAQMFGGAPIDGIRCESMEGAVLHIHQHLQLFDRGRPVQVPAGVGIPSAANCLYWLHTHTSDGIIHVESPTKRTFTLGEFFDIWDQSLSRVQAAGVRAARGKTLRVTVNGRLYSGNPRSITLRDHEEIVIQNGPPFGHPVSYDWSRM
ncbi:MAG: hypothetical protein JO177_06985 [Candidatus Eremiobacteraeota bacterium]|nr:hypothetical protein [Candidatus Eremiobacteraeota bacterium]